MSRSLHFEQLGEIATYINGKPFKPSEWSDSGIPILRIQNLTGQAYEQNYYSGNDLPSKYLCKDGDILISWSGSLGIYEWKGDIAAVNQHIFKVVFDKKKVDKRYFVHAVTSVLGEMGRNTHGSTMKHITKPDFDATRIFLPPLPEQKRIAAILDSADAIRQKRKAAIAKLDELAQSVFLEMFGDPMKNEKGWESDVIGSLTKLYNGYPFKPSDWLESDENGAIPIIRIQNLNNPDAVFNYTLKKIPDKHRAKKNDLLFSWSGSIGTSFGPHIWKGGDGYINQHIFRVDHTGNVKREYFYWALKNIVHLVEEKAHGGVGLVHITKGELEKIRIAVPPLHHQKEFVMRLSKVTELRKLHIKSRLREEALFSSLQNRAFTGEL